MLSIESNIAELRRELRGFQHEQLPFAVSMALNEAGADLIEENKRNLASSFDNPTRWTLNAFRLQRSTKARLVASIRRKDMVGRRHYLEVQAKGGGRAEVGFERKFGAGFIAAPKARRDGFGNIARAELRRIIAQTGGGAAPSSRRGAALFVVAKGSRLKPGVYQRRGKSISRLLAFDAKAPSYRKRYDFEGPLVRRGSQIMPGLLSAAMARALATARR